MSKLQYADIDADILGSPGKGKWSPVWAMNLRWEKAVLPILELLVTIADSWGKWNFTKENLFGGMISEISVPGQVAPLLTIGPVVIHNIGRVHRGLKSFTHNNWRRVRKRTKVRSQHFHQRCSSIDPTSSREPLPPVVSLLATRPLTHKTLKRKWFRFKLSIYMCQQ